MPPSVWLGATCVALIALLNGLIGIGVSRYHRRDEVHAAKTMRPGVLLGAHITLLVFGAVGILVVSAVALASVE